MQARVAGGYVHLRLHGTQVHAEHVCLRVLVRHLDGPEAGTRPDVEDALHLLRVQRREVELAGHDEGEDVILQVEPVELRLVVGERVIWGFVSFEGMIRGSD